MTTTEVTGRLTRPDGHSLAWRRTPGRGPTLLWLGGFASDMAGTKAQALADWAAGAGRDVLRFDYTGHGQSSGAFRDGTIGAWRADAVAVLDELTGGKVVLVGSSMGGWMACLLALARPERVGALVLIAPAADFTERLIGPSLTPEQHDRVEADGFCSLAPSYEPEGLVITRALLEDGARWSILGGPVAISAPVRVIHGGEDPDVPWAHALELFQALEGRDAVFSLIKDGDHRLSRPQDLARIVQAVEEAAALV